MQDLPGDARDPAHGPEARVPDLLGRQVPSCTVRHVGRRPVLVHPQVPLVGLVVRVAVPQVQRGTVTKWLPEAGIGVGTTAASEVLRACGTAPPSTGAAVVALLGPGVPWVEPRARPGVGHSRRNGKSIQGKHWDPWRLRPVVSRWWSPIARTEVAGAPPPLRPDRFRAILPPVTARPSRFFPDWPLCRNRPRDGLATRSEAHRSVRSEPRAHLRSPTPDEEVPWAGWWASPP